MTRTRCHVLVDAHAHLDLLPDVDQEIRKAASLGVRSVIGVSMGVESMAAALGLAQAFPGRVLPALGLHPWRIEEEDIDRVFETMEENLGRAVAVGEIGLDYKIKTKKPLQRDLFRRQLGLARRKGLPVIVHCRYSHRRALQLVEEEDVPRAVYHWYTGPLDLIDRIVDRGDFVSATPALAYSEMHREAVRRVPLAHLLVETDSPVVYQGEEATPSMVLRVCDLVAALKGVSGQEVACQTTENVKRFLGDGWPGEPA